MGFWEENNFTTTKSHDWFAFKIESSAPPSPSVEHWSTSLSKETAEISGLFTCMTIPTSSISRHTLHLLDHKTQVLLLFFPRDTMFKTLLLGQKLENEMGKV